MRNVSKIFSAVLATSILLTTIPVAALSRNSEGYGSTIVNSEEGNTDYINPVQNISPENYSIPDTDSKIIKNNNENHEDLDAQVNSNTDKNNNAVKLIALDEKEKYQLIVKYKDTNKKEQVKKSIKANLKLAKFETIKSFTKIKTEVIDIGNSSDVQSVIKEFEKNSNVEYVQPNYKLSSAVSVPMDIKDINVSNPRIELDTFYSLKKETNIGTSINIEEAWKLTKGSEEVVVGVLDSGISVSHKDLADNIFINKKEIPNNNIDDDNNGYIDDINGWDFANNDNVVDDSYVGIHGTHIAGIISAAQNNRGISGIAPKVKILPLKFINDRYGYTSDAINAIEYAKALGVKIINCSWGSEYFNPALKEAMKSSDILFICSAGNNNKDVTLNPVYPACFDLPNVLSIASVDKNNRLSKFSSYGKEVDLAAPGEDVLSTLPANTYQKLSGTSMSAAYTTGVAALLKSYKPNASSSDIVNALKTNVTKSSGLEGKVNSKGIIDAYQALSNIILGIQPENEIINDPIDNAITFDNLNEEMADSPISNPFKYDKYNSGQYTKNINEDVQKSDGSLNLQNSLLSLKGRNGLDLNLNLMYDSSKANIYDADYQQNLQFSFNYWTWYFKSMNQVTDFVPLFYYNGTPYYTTVEPSGVYSTSHQGYTSTYESNTYDDTYIQYLVKQQYWVNAGSYPDPVYKFLVLKYMSYGNIIVNYDNCLNVNNDTTYSEKYGNIGSGWNWSFSSIETVKDQKYLHLNSGSTYKIEMTSTSGDSNLKDYNLRDIRLENDSSYSNGTLTSAYALFYKDGKREYFDNDGKLIGILDKFNNQIKLEYYAGQTKLSKITDTVGRVITFTYNEGSTNRTLTVTLSDPGSSSIVLTSEKVSGYSNDYVLKSIKNQEQQTTTFDYSVDSAGYNYFSRQSSVVAAKNNVFANLKKVTYATGAYTDYTYEKTTGNLGNCGVQDYYRVKTRKDCTNNNIYESRTFNYSSSNYTGYPNYTDPSSLGSDYTYTTTVVDSENNETVYGYNYKHLLMYQTTKENGKSINSLYDSFEYDTNKMLQKHVNRKYNNSSGSYMERIEKFQYDTFGDLMYYWNPLALGDTSNNEYKTAYIYDSTYHYITKKTYKKDKNTTIVETYTPYATDAKNIEWSTISENGILKRQTRFIYDSYGNITEERKFKDGFSEYISTFYNYDDNDISRQNKINGLFLTKKTTTDVRDADGILTKDKNGKNTGIVEEIFKYDWYGNIVEQTEANGNATLRQYDKLGRIKKEIHQSDGSFKTWTYKTDLQENSVIISDENTNSTQYTSYGSLVKLIYDGFGKLLYEQKYTKNPVTGTESYVSVNQYAYDSENRLDSEKNLVTGALTDYIYYKDSRLNIKQINDTKNSNSLLYKETITYDDASGMKTTKIEGDSNAPAISLSTYADKLGRVTSQTKLHTVETITNFYKDTFEYDYLGNKISEKTARAYDETATYPSCEYTTKYDYDYAGNVIKTTNADGTFATAKYDALGRLKSTADFKSNLTSPEAYSTTYVYDNLGRLIQETIPFEKADTTGIVYCTVKKHYYDRNGNIISEMVSNSKPDVALTFSKVDYEYNGRNMLTKVITYNKGNPENYTQYYYDNSGNKLRMYTGLNKPLYITELDVVATTGDPDYSTTKYEYDRLGMLVKMTDPTGKAERYTYDLNGNILNKIDKNGSNINMTYDAMGRLINNTVTNTENPESNNTYAYTYTLTGNRKTMSSGGVDTTYYYDDLGHLIKEAASNGTQKEYTYDAANNRKSLVLKVNGAQRTNTSYLYDKMNRLYQVFENGSLIATYTYDTNGNRDTLTTANGNVAVYQYNIANKIKLITNKKGTSVLSSYEYSYFLDGNQAAKTDNSGKLTSYIYDSLGRLTSEVPGGEPVISYTYDDSNNRSSMTVSGNSITTYAYDKANRLQAETKAEGQSSQITRYNYDDNGNTICKTVEVLSPDTEGQNTSISLSDKNSDVTLYEYDGFNQLTKTTTGDATVTYTYNGDGLRTSKAVNGNTTRHIWDGDQIALELNNAGAVTNKYVRGINLIYSEDGAGANKRYFQYNGHGDTTQLTDTSGNVVKSYDYDAFGNEKNPDANDTNVFRYCGEYFDKETGTIYLRARYYEPEIGRFITEDSYWGKDNDPLSLNLYTYCSNNPVMFIDPTGHMNYLTQTDNLLAGIGAGIGDSVMSILKSPMTLITITKALISGDISMKDLASAGLEGMIGDYKYVIENAGILSPWKSASDAEVKEIGKHAGAIITDMVLALTGAGAAKLTKVLSKTSDGAKMLKALEGLCFTGDTLIYSVDGYKSIKDIQIGDEVYSENPETGEKGLKKVKNVYINETDRVIHVYAGSQEIKTTPSHPFWVVGKGWVEAVDIVVGDKLLMYNGNILEVKKLRAEQLSEPIKAYNFEVEDWHTYFVSEQNVLVHNSCKATWDIVKYAKDKVSFSFQGKKMNAFMDKNGLWWSKDLAGHGGSTYKVFKKEGKTLKWYSDADEYGNFITDKHKGDTGMVIKLN